MSSPFEMVIAIVLIGTVGSLIKFQMQQKAKTGGNRESIGANEKRISQLEERVQVLERIVTDGRNDLRRELDALNVENR
ncbi:MAG: hypothetical protein LJE84_02495 [Gammaproteobacteria bacterium]|jgi:hypothetical protein|nr:hypothetical protein [Gammaproteobacteria bacterium]